MPAFALSSLPSAVHSLFGKQAFDTLSNEINEIIQTGSSFIGNQNASSKSQGTQPFDPIPQIPISRSYGIEIKGVSVDQLMNIWNNIRYNQETVSGDIFPVKDSADQVAVYMSWSSSGETYHWTSPGFAPTDSALELSLWNTAEHFIKETNPEIAGRYYLSKQDYRDAITAFKEWMILEPFRPEPYLYLAKTFDLIGDFGKATQFSDRALELLARALRKSRNRVRVGVYLVESLSLFESRDDQDVSRLQRFVDANLPNDPNARQELSTFLVQMCI
jgi:tetratricopeptide (TPR) repeat protein